MTDFRKCPGCGFNEKRGFFTGNHFDVYQCQKCKKRFCYQCDGSNNGSECPRCNSTDYETIGQVYLRD